MLVDDSNYGRDNAVQVDVEAAVSSNERTDFDTFTLVTRTQLESLTQQLDALVEVSDTDIYYKDGEPELTQQYAQTVLALSELINGASSLMKRVNTTYRLWNNT